MRQELLQAAGEILADMRDGKLARLSQNDRHYKERMAEIIGTHLALDARDCAAEDAKARIERLTLGMQGLERQLRQSRLSLTEARRWLNELGGDRGNGD